MRDDRCVVGSFPSGGDMAEMVEPGTSAAVEDRLAGFEKQLGQLVGAVQALLSREPAPPPAPAGSPPVSEGLVPPPAPTSSLVTLESPPATADVSAESEKPATPEGFRDWVAAAVATAEPVKAGYVPYLASMTRKVMNLIAGRMDPVVEQRDSGYSDAAQAGRGWGPKPSLEAMKAFVLGNLAELCRSLQWAFTLCGSSSDAEDCADRRNAKWLCLDVSTLAALHFALSQTGLGDPELCLRQLIVPDRSDTIWQFLRAELAYRAIAHDAALRQKGKKRKIRKKPEALVAPVVAMIVRAWVSHHSGSDLALLDLVSCQPRPFPTVPIPAKRRAELLGRSLAVGAGS